MVPRCLLGCIDDVDNLNNFIGDIRLANAPYYAPHNINIVIIYGWNEC